MKLIKINMKYINLKKKKLRNFIKNNQTEVIL